MKIAIIIERADINLGGAERSVFEMAAAISKLGQDVEILAAKGSSEAKNIRILCQDKLGSRTSHSIFAAALKKHLSENHYDIIQSVLPFSFADIYQPRGGTYAESVARNAATYENRIAQILKMLTACANINRTILLRAERKLASGTDGPRIVALSQYVASQFKQHYETNPQRITVIPSGISTDLQPDLIETENLHAHILNSLNISRACAPVLFLFAGNDFRRKGLVWLMRALLLTLSRNPQSPAYLIVAGHRQVSYYRKLSSKLNVAGRIIFLDNLSHIRNVLAVADVAVLPTFQDACSRFILEALAAGKPVITTKFNGATDLFVNNRHGKVIDTPNNITALAEAISYFSRKENIQKASQAIAADNLKEKISINRVAKQLIELYELILHNKGLK